MVAAVLEQFDHVANTWDPPVQVDHDVVTAEGPRRFAALLDMESPVTRHGDRLPPLWHWFLFLPLHQQSQLGPDGHPLDAPFMPPLGPRRRMFGGGRLELRHPLRCGDRVRRASEVIAVRSRRGRSGPLLLVGIRHTLSVDGTVCVVEEQDIVYRAPVDVPRAAAHGHHDPPPPRPRGRARDREVVPPRSPWALSITTDPVLLFRFSALTANAHRIHYDQQYARQVEDHPDLVVHGPLLALLLLELPRRFQPQRSVAALSWRARAPLFVGQEVRVQGWPNDDGATLAAGANSTLGAVTGELTFRAHHEEGLE